VHKRRYKSQGGSGGNHTIEKYEIFFLDTI
jgi:hypothetical protein